MRREAPAVCTREGRLAPSCPRGLGVSVRAPVWMWLVYGAEGGIIRMRCAGRWMAAGGSLVECARGEGQVQGYI